MRKNNKILEYLTWLTENRECTQAEIAEHCGVTQPTISRILSGRQAASLEMKASLVEFAEIRRKKSANLEKRIKKLSA